MKDISVPLDGMSVTVGIPAGRDFDPRVVKSILGTFNTCYRMNIPCDLGMVANCAIVTKARDEVIDLFLKSENKKLFWVDSDMVWTPDQFIRMLALSTLYGVVCAAYPAKLDQKTFYMKYDEAAGLTRNEHGLFEIHGIGLGFTVMDRRVIEDVVSTKPRYKDQVNNREMAAVFRTDILDGNFRGEDIAFFDDIRAAGHKVFLDPDTALGHIGTKEYRGSILDAFKPVAQSDHNNRADRAGG